MDRFLQYLDLVCMDGFALQDGCSEMIMIAKDESIGICFYQREEINDYKKKARGSVTRI